MERNLHEPEIYDFRQHDRLWQRVRRCSSASEEI